MAFSRGNATLGQLCSGWEAGILQISRVPGMICVMKTSLLIFRKLKRFPGVRRRAVYEIDY